MTENPLTQKAVLKLRALAEGNGLEAKDIVLLGTDEAVLNLRGEMLLSLDIARNKASYAGPLQNPHNISSARIQKVQTEAEVDGAAEKMREKMSASSNWAKEAVRYLKEQPGEGWGIENADITLDDLSQLVYLQSMCPACAGQGLVNCVTCQGKGTLPCSYCHATGVEPCINCNGSGVNATNPNQYCLYCNGSTTQPCRQCRGTRQMNCSPCRGQARIKCQSCHGDGMFIIEEAHIPTARAVFRIVDTGDLPSGFRRALSRGGPKSLTRGHATIAMLEIEERDKNNVTVPYKAALPFAEARLKIAGKAMRASILGQKGVILDLPPFLDTALEPHVKGLEAAVSSSDSLTKALQWKALKDAFSLVQQGRGDAKSLRSLYPAGLSVDMAARLITLINTLMNEQTKLMRLAAGGAMVLLACGLSFVVMQSGLRAGLAQMAKPIAAFIFDILFIALNLFALNFALRFLAAKQLQKRLGAAAEPPMQAMRGLKGGKIGLVASVLIVIIYVGLLFSLNVLPTWSAILKSPLG